jgi:proteasome lid subunit RPN8/RPN11
MGCLIGHLDESDASGVVVIRAVPLPCKGGAHSAEGTAEAMAALNEVRMLLETSCAEGRECETIVGWYHSHPGLTCFFSGIDVETQAVWQRAFHRDGLPWLGAVIDPVQSLSEGRITLAVYGCYSHGRNFENEAPDGNYVNADDAEDSLRARARWGGSYPRYYEMESRIFGNSAHARILWAASVAELTPLHRSQTPQVASSMLRGVSCGKWDSSSENIDEGYPVLSNSAVVSCGAGVQHRCCEKLFGSCPLAWSRKQPAITLEQDLPTTSSNDEYLPQPLCHRASEKVRLAQGIQKISKVYRSVDLASLASMLATDEIQIERTIAIMLAEGKLRGTIDLVGRFVEFVPVSQGSREDTNNETYIKSVCELLRDAAEFAAATTSVEP